ncbi:alpha-hydroxy acid oxidase [Kerstersia gyiorum]|uniref:alpha-hydroxy acid oxidase n=1 Tax=Kerstersia gyiorum TaxID=206506 RepID=UPI0022263056|nr:alpha-hydroxy acid oxidase [Kerstersia gyiorum]
MLERVACINDFRELARRRLPRMVFDYIDGAVGDETTARRNRQALDQVLLQQEVLVDVSRRSVASELFGQAVAMPVVIGPTGLNGAYWRNGDLCLARAAQSRNIPFVMSTAATVGLSTLVEAAGPMRWFQLYMLKDRVLNECLLERLVAEGFSVLELTVDTAVAGRRNRDIRNGFTLPFRWTLPNLWDTARHPQWALAMLQQGAPSLKLFAESIGTLPQGKTISEVMAQQISSSFTWHDLEWLRARWPGKLVLKGIATAVQTRQAISMGIDGVVVSNHGGRQQEGSRASIESLPEVVDAAGGQCTVLIDSGFRNGADIAKALALGADGVQLGRATLYALSAAGEVGVCRALDILSAELDQAMALSGAVSIAQLRGRATSFPVSESVI